jgi:hypothetical protein
MSNALKVASLSVLILTGGLIVSYVNESPKAHAQQDSFKQVLEILRAKSRRLELISNGLNIAPLQAKIVDAGEDYVKVQKKSDSSTRPDFNYYIPYSAISRIEEVEGGGTASAEIIKIVLR